MQYSKIHFTADSKPEAQRTLATVLRRYGQTVIDHADVVVAVGGDGHMLSVLRQQLITELPVYGINRGSVGYLMNHMARYTDLYERINNTTAVAISPLEMVVTDDAQISYKILAFNEVSLHRQTNQAAKIQVTVNDVVRIDELIGDGVLVSTPVGSTAYNMALGGSVLPLGTPSLVVTPNAVYQPRRWAGAIVPITSTFDFEIFESQKRPVSATGDSYEVRDVVSVSVAIRDDQQCTILSDRSGLYERALSEQFS